MGGPSPEPPLLSTGNRPPAELAGPFPVPADTPPAPNAPPLPGILPVLLLHAVKRTSAPKRKHALHSGIVAVPRLLAVEIGHQSPGGLAPSRYDTSAAA